MKTPDRTLILAALSILLFGFGVPSFLFSGTHRVFPSFEALLAWLLMVYASARLGMYAARGEKRLFSLTFWVFTYIFLGLAPLVELMTRTFVYTNRYSPSEIRLTFLLIFIATIAYEAGVGIGDRLRVPMLFREVMLERRISEWRTLGLALIVPAICAVLIHMLGGILLLFLPRSVFETTAIGAGGAGLARYEMIVKLLRVPPFVAMYFAWACYLEYVHLCRRRLRWRYLVALAGLAAVNVIVSNPISAERLWCGTIGLSFLFFTFRWKRRWAFFAWASGLILAFVFLFPYMDMFRYALTGRAADFSSKALVEELTTKSDYAEFQVLIESTRYVDAEGLSMGRQFMGTVASWVPRSVWKSKPYPSGMVVSRHAGWGQFEAIALLLIGEAYIDGGVIAVALLFLLYGVGSAFAERIYLSAQSPGTGFGQVLVPMLAPLQFFILRGSLFAVFGYLAPLLICCAALTVARRRAPGAEVAVDGALASA